MPHGKRFHLGWFANFCVDGWNEQWGSTGGQDWSGSFYVELVQHLERAKFDYLLLEDKLMVSDAYGGASSANSNTHCTHRNMIRHR